MGLKVATEASQVAPGAGTITSDRRLYLAKDEKTMVEEGGEEARYLLVAEGGEIPPDTVKRLGLEVKGGKVTQSVEKMAEEVAHSQSALERMAGGDQKEAQKALDDIKQKALDEAEAKKAAKSAGNQVVDTHYERPPLGAAPKTTSRETKMTAPATPPKSGAATETKAPKTTDTTKVKEAAQPADKSRTPAGNKGAKGRGK
jgi:hypothetical protein